MRKTVAFLAMVMALAAPAAAENDICTETQEAHGFLATYRVSSGKPNMFQYPSYPGRPYVSEVTLDIGLPVLGEQYPVQGTEAAQTAMLIHMDLEYSMTSLEDKKPFFEFAITTPALESMLAQSQGSRDLICRYRTPRGSTHSSALKWNEWGRSTCQIPLDDLFPGGKSEGTAFRFVLQSPEDGRAYYIADYPAQLPQEISSQITSRVQWLGEIGEQNYCMYGTLGE